jgi:hypothetical protein
VKELFEGVVIGLPGVRRAHGIADQLSSCTQPVDSLSFVVNELLTALKL